MANKLWLSIALVLVLACGQAAQEATPTPTAAPTPSAGATATPRPAGTSTPTPRLAPTATVAPAVPKPGGIVRIPVDADPPAWDPSLFHQDRVNTPKFLVFTKLINNWPDLPQNCKTGIRPEGAESWRWVDDTTLEVTLRQGIKYQNQPPVNGREMVASDFVASFQRFRNLAAMVGHSQRVKSVVATGKYTFQMKLDSPFPGIVTEMIVHRYGPWVEPAEITGADWDWSNPVKAWIGSGPFTFQKWTPGVKYTLERNPAYWAQGRVYLAGVEFVVMPDVSTQFAALRSRQMDLVQALPDPLVEAVVTTAPAGLQVVSCPSTGRTGAGALFMNTSGPPFNDVRVRRAVFMAIDRKGVIDSLFGGKAEFYPVLPPLVPYAMTAEDFPPQVRQYLEYHPDRAKQLLAEAGYPKGFDTAINFTGTYPAPNTAVAEALVAMLAKVDIRAKLNLLERSRFSLTVVRAEYPVGELAITPSTPESPESPHALANAYSKIGTFNRSLIRDPEYDAIYERFSASTDEAVRTQLARQMQTMAVDKVYKVLLPFPPINLVAQSGIHLTWTGLTADLNMVIITAWRD